MKEPLLAALFEDLAPRAMTVSELNSDIRIALERRFSNVWVEGEVVNFLEAASGHWYFSLADGNSFIKATCFKNQNYRIRFMPFDGLQVQCRGRITTYEKRGEYQLSVDSLEPIGEGALAVAFEQIKAKLLREGLFNDDLKRPLPHFPRRVGVVTSPDGAALHDILQVLDRRARSVDIVLIPTQVQGETAGRQIADAIRLVNRFCDSCLEHERIDVLIVGRGGGSAEDLWAFNEEQVARAIRASNIPIISAVGHEVDITIADMVADLRAPTPSAAAEIVAQSEREVMGRIGQFSRDLVRQMEYKMIGARSDLQSLEMAAVFAEFPGRLREKRHCVEQLATGSQIAVSARLAKRNEVFGAVTGRLSPARLAAAAAKSSKRLSLLNLRAESAAVGITGGRSANLASAMARLNALSPLGVLTRGYSITQKTSGEIVRDPHQTSVGEQLRITLAGGKIEAEVTRKADL
ncbi:MAG: exodeoxyribonuclease VII large subunit [Acidobacteria bacterium]|nr:exodeoxyribonuclease VII large subunit [Acidobacteriota bacterium]